MTVSMSGYVTTLESVIGRTDYELERLLGYSPKRFSAGFRLYALADTVRANEFAWKDKTRFSDGWHGDRSIKFGKGGHVGWKVRRQDELRSALGRKLNYDERAVDLEIDKIMQKSLDELNVRTGSKKIVKVCPISNTPAGYPDAPSGNTPQWELTVDKQFMLMGKFSRKMPNFL